MNQPSITYYRTNVAVIGEIYVNGTKCWITNYFVVTVPTGQTAKTIDTRIAENPADAIILLLILLSISALYIIHLRNKCISPS